MRLTYPLSMNHSLGQRGSDKKGCTYLKFLGRVHKSDASIIIYIMILLLFGYYIEAETIIIVTSPGQLTWFDSTPM